MMKRKIFALLVLWFALLPWAVQAQVQPTSGVISFKGTIPGQPDGPVDLRFRVFPVDVGGAFCFEETQLGVQVTTETFSVFIGDGTTGGIPPSPCFTDNTSLWIAFGLDADPDTELAVRVAITSSGYAHFALGVTDNAVTTAKIQDDAVTSAKIAAGSVDGTKIVDGSVGAADVDSSLVQLRVVGVCAPGQAMREIDASGNVTCEPTGGGGGIGGSGTANSIPKFTGAATIGDSAITEVGGNVGIGTMVPNERLEVAGNLRLPPSTSTVGVIKSGPDRFIHNFGASNFFAGVNAGNFTLSGGNGFGANTGVGVNALQSLTTGTQNTASGAGALRTNTTGGDNTASGVTALFRNTTGNRNTAIGTRADVSAGDLFNATAIGADATVNASNKVRIGSSSIVVIEGQVPFTSVSDKTKMENFQPLDGEEVLKKIRNIPVHSWNFIGQDPKQFRHYGPNAQEFFAAFGNDGIGAIGSPTTINSGDMAGILMIAVQTLERQNVDLRARVEALERLLQDKPYLTAAAEPIQ